MVIETGGVSWQVKRARANFSGTGAWPNADSENKSRNQVDKPTMTGLDSVLVDIAWSMC